MAAWLLSTTTMPALYRCNILFAHPVMGISLGIIPLSGNPFTHPIRKKGSLRVKSIDPYQ